MIHNPIKNTSRVTINTLPSEILQTIFQKLPIYDRLSTLPRVCRHWYRQAAVTPFPIHIQVTVLLSLHERYFTNALTVSSLRLDSFSTYQSKIIGEAAVEVKYQPGAALKQEDTQDLAAYIKALESPILKDLPQKKSTSLAQNNSISSYYAQSNTTTTNNRSTNNSNSTPHHNYGHVLSSTTHSSNRINTSTTTTTTTSNNTDSTTNTTTYFPFHLLLAAKLRRQWNRLCRLPQDTIYHTLAPRLQQVTVYVESPDLIYHAPTYNQQFAPLLTDLFSILGTTVSKEEGCNGPETLITSSASLPLLHTLPLTHTITSPSSLPSTQKSNNSLRKLKIGLIERDLASGLDYLAQHFPNLEELELTIQSNHIYTNPNTTTTTTGHHNGRRSMVNLFLLLQVAPIQLDISALAHLAQLKRLRHFTLLNDLNQIQLVMSGHSTSTTPPETNQTQPPTYPYLYHILGQLTGLRTLHLNPRLLPRRAKTLPEQEKEAVMEDEEQAMVTMLHSLDHLTTLDLENPYLTFWEKLSSTTKSHNKSKKPLSTSSTELQELTLHYTHNYLQSLLDDTNLDPIQNTITSIQTNVKKQIKTKSTHSKSKAKSISNEDEEGEEEFNQNLKGISYAIPLRSLDEASSSLASSASTLINQPLISNVNSTSSLSTSTTTSNLNLLDDDDDNQTIHGDSEDEEEFEQETLNDDDDEESRRRRRRLEMERRQERLYQFFKQTVKAVGENYPNLKTLHFTWQAHHHVNTPTTATNLTEEEDEFNTLSLALPIELMSTALSELKEHTQLKEIHLLSSCIRDIETVQENRNTSLSTSSPQSPSSNNPYTRAALLSKHVKDVTNYLTHDLGSNMNIKVYY